MGFDCPPCQPSTCGKWDSVRHNRNGKLCLSHFWCQALLHERWGISFEHFCVGQLIETSNAFARFDTHTLVGKRMQKWKVKLSAPTIDWAHNWIIEWTIYRFSVLLRDWACQRVIQRSFEWLISYMPVSMHTIYTDLAVQCHKHKFQYTNNTQPIVPTTHSRLGAPKKETQCGPPYARPRRWWPWWLSEWIDRLESQINKI